MLSVLEHLASNDCPKHYIFIEKEDIHTFKFNIYHEMEKFSRRQIDTFLIIFLKKKLKKYFKMTSAEKFSFSKLSVKKRLIRSMRMRTVKTSLSLSIYRISGYWRMHRLAGKAQIRQYAF